MTIKRHITIEALFTGGLIVSDVSDDGKTDYAFTSADDGIRWLRQELVSKPFEPETQEPAADQNGWIKWEGGKCPVDRKTRVEIEFRGGCRNSGGARRAAGARMTPSPRIQQINSFKDWYFGLERVAWKPVISRAMEPERGDNSGPICAASAGNSDAENAGPFKAVLRLNPFTGNPRVNPFHQSPRDLANRFHEFRPSVTGSSHADEPSEDGMSCVTKELTGKARCL